MTVFDLILMRYLLHYGPISVKKCCVIFCIMRYAIFSLRYTFFKVIMQRTNTVYFQYFSAKIGIFCHMKVIFRPVTSGYIDFRCIWRLRTRLKSICHPIHVQKKLAENALMCNLDIKITLTWSKTDLE